MKLDKDLVRSILLAIEENDDQPTGWINIDVPDRSVEEVSYHVELLNEAGLVEAYDLTTMSSYEWRPKRLTYEGHEYLDTIRDSHVWKETKEIAGKVGAGSLKMLFEIGRAYIKQQLTIHGLHLQ